LTIRFGTFVSLDPRHHVFDRETLLSEGDRTNVSVRQICRQISSRIIPTTFQTIDNRQTLYN